MGRTIVFSFNVKLTDEERKKLEKEAIKLLRLLEKHYINFERMDVIFRSNGKEMKITIWQD